MCVSIFEFMDAEKWQKWNVFPKKQRQQHNTILCISNLSYSNVSPKRAALVLMIGTREMWICPLKIHTSHFILTKYLFLEWKHDVLLHGSRNNVTISATITRHGTCSWFHYPSFVGRTWRTFISNCDCEKDPVMKWFTWGLWLHRVFSL